MKIAMACDHGALDYKNMIKEMLVEMPRGLERTLQRCHTRWQQ